MSLSTTRAILKTLIYSDVFEYPLTFEELVRWLIEIKSQKSKVRNTIKNSKIIKGKDDYFYLRDRERVVKLRQEREKWSKRKLIIAREIANYLKLIPMIKLVGITGALAVDNAKKEDDIDLFIITSAGYLWTTRLLATLLVEITGKRRHPNERNVENKICLNMFNDGNHLSIPKNEQDLFSAHEVAQMRLIWDRDNTYKKFLVANRWVKKYLPNVCQELVLSESGKDTSDGGETTISTPPRWRKQQKIIEHLLRRFQLWYMRDRRTTEVIRDGYLRFHPHDAREWVMKEYEKKTNNLLTDS